MSVLRITQEGELRSAFVVHSSLDADLDPKKTEIGTANMPMGVYKSKDGVLFHVEPYSIHFPLGSGASYLQHVPHYEKKYFICDFGGVWLVGWYYVRHPEPGPANPNTAERDADWQKLWKQDTRINISQIVLKARDDQGSFIRGKVWLALFSIPSLRINPVSLLYGVPKWVMHGDGWGVPSFALTPGWWNNKVAREPYPTPNYKYLAQNSSLAVVPLPPPLGEKNTPPWTKGGGWG